MLEWTSTAAVLHLQSELLHLELGGLVPLHPLVLDACILHLERKSAGLSLTRKMSLA
jgi:hypothetical protein